MSEADEKLLELAGRIKVKSHTRTSEGGGVVQVKSYTRAPWRVLGDLLESSKSEADAKAAFREEFGRGPTRGELAQASFQMVRSKMSPRKAPPGGAPEPGSPSQAAARKYPGLASDEAPGVLDPELASLPRSEWAPVLARRRAEARAAYEETARRLHRQYPDLYPDPDAPAATPAQERLAGIAARPGPAPGAVEGYGGGSVSDMLAEVLAGLEHGAAAPPGSPAAFRGPDTTKSSVEGKSVMDAAPVVPAEAAPDIPGLTRGAPRSVRDAAFGGAANPHYGEKTAKGHKNAGYSTNCQRCVQTVELRVRGYDAVAQPLPRKSQSGGLNEAYPLTSRTRFYWVTEAGMPAPVMRFGSGSSWADVREEVEKNWPEGGRGFVDLRFANGGGHVMNVVKAGGKMELVEGQVDKGSPDWVMGASRPLTLMRVDNCAPVPEMMSGDRGVAMPADAPTPAGSDDPDKIAAHNALVKGYKAGMKSLRDRFYDAEHPDLHQEGDEPSETQMEWLGKLQAMGFIPAGVDLDSLDAVEAAEWISKAHKEGMI